MTFQFNLIPLLYQKHELLLSNASYMCGTNPGWKPGLPGVLMGSCPLLRSHHASLQKHSAPPPRPPHPPHHVLCKPAALEARTSDWLASAIHPNHLAPGLAECTLKEVLKPNGGNRASH